MKDSFIVNLAVQLAFKLFKKHAAKWVGSYILVGPIGFVLSYFAERFLGYVIDQGILAVDLGVMSAKVAMEQKEYEDIAKKAYLKASKKVWDEEEKSKIRKEYLDALDKFAHVGKLRGNSSTQHKTSR